MKEEIGELLKRRIPLDTVKRAIKKAEEARSAIMQKVEGVRVTSGKSKKIEIIHIKELKWEGMSERRL